MFIIICEQSESCYVDGNGNPMSKAECVWWAPGGVRASCTWEGHEPLCDFCYGAIAAFQLAAPTFRGWAAVRVLWYERHVKENGAASPRTPGPNGRYGGSGGPRLRQSFKVGKLNLVDLAGSERVRPCNG